MINKKNWLLIYVYIRIHIHRGFIFWGMEENEKMTMFKFKHPSSSLIVGPSQSGKSSLVREIIKKKLYDPSITKVKWCYSYSAPWFLEEPSIEFIPGLPDTYENGDLIVIDDLMQRLNDRIADLFTAASHHCNVSVIVILQNLFPRLKVMRDISLNAHYIILFRNARDVNQVNCLGRQIYPRNSRFLTDAYIKATTKPYGYLVIDLHPQTTDEYRLRESLFPCERGYYWLFQPK